MASDTDLSADELFPVMTAWQEIQFKRMELDLKSGAGWHAGAVSDPVPATATTAEKLLELKMEVASWFLGAENKYIKVDAPDTRLGANDIVKVAKQMMLERFSNTRFENLVWKKLAR
jgi:hypothetical protein